MMRQTAALQIKIERGQQPLVEMAPPQRHHAGGRRSPSATRRATPESESNYASYRAHLWRTLATHAPESLTTKTIRSRLPEFCAGSLCHAERKTGRTPIKTFRQWTRTGNVRTGRIGTSTSPRCFPKFAPRNISSFARGIPARWNGWRRRYSFVDSSRL